MDDERRKANSTSNMFIDSTIENPNIKEIVQAVAQLLFTTILEDMNLGKKVVSETSEAYLFFEDKYLKDNPELFNKPQIAILLKTPTKEDISDFIYALYDLLKFSGECCVICLTYIYRLVALTDLPILATNWRPLVLISLLVAQKMWDDFNLANNIFAEVYPFFDLSQINLLEIKFLQLIEYNLNVKQSIYTKYYLELKGLLPKNDILRPMDAFTMNLIDTKSKNYEENVKKNSRTSNDIVGSGKGTIYVIN